METNHIRIERIEEQIKYYALLAKHFPTITDASSEIINLRAILNLPKGTEHFLSDLHGEHEAFSHMLKNGSGIIRKKMEEVFSTTLHQREKRTLATLIYYPKEVLAHLSYTGEERLSWYEITLHRLVHVCREVSSKYTRSKVRKALPIDYAYIIEELLHEQENMPNKHNYYAGIIQTIVDTEQSEPFIKAICELIQRLSVDKLHIIGDIYDRGPGAYAIMEDLIHYHSIDVQWGNHDIAWMGAAAGSQICIANVVRVSTRYNNLASIEEGYGINLLPLVKFAMETYPTFGDAFKPKIDEEQDNEDAYLVGQMQKAIAIIAFKLEGQLAINNPSYELEHRLFLDKIDYNNGTIQLNEQVYPLSDKDFPTIDPANPYLLTDREKDVMAKLSLSFMKNEKLIKHMNFLISNGSIYKTYNGNLLYHGCIPLNEEGDFLAHTIHGKEYRGKALLDKFDRMVRSRFKKRFEVTFDTNEDVFWYLCCGAKSSLFGKDKMATFERYFLNDKATHKEEKNSYYQLINSEEVCIKILHEFGLFNENAKIINGHVPVKVSKGESPVKANGRYLVIDGGLSKAYQSVTGIAGYTLIYNSYGMILAAHEPFESKKKAIEEDKDIISNLSVIWQEPFRLTVGDTDNGIKIQHQITDLENLVFAYKAGIISEQ